MACVQGLCAAFDTVDDNPGNFFCITSDIDLFEVSGSTLNWFATSLCPHTQ